MEKRIVISKRLYKFELKHKFQYVKQYKIKERSRLEHLKDSLSGLFKGKPKQDAKEQRPPGFNPGIVVGALVFALLILIVGWFYLSSQLAAATEISKPVEKPDFTLVVKEQSVITAGDRRSGDNIAYVKLNLSYRGLERYNLTLTTYAEDLPTEVFMLQSPREQAEGYDDFAASLKKELAKQKIVLNEIDFEKLETLPGGSVVIVPTGLIPEELIGINSNLDLNKLISRKVVIIYIGQKFDKVLAKSGPRATAVKIDGLPMTFDEQKKLVSNDNLTLFQPLYQARSTGAGVENFIIYGSVSVVKKDGGALIMLPQTIDGGWIDEEGRADPAQAGKDVAKILTESRWEQPGGSRTYSIEAGNRTNEETDFFTQTFSSEVRSVKMEFAGYAQNNITLYQTKVIPVKRLVSGALYVEGGAVVTPKEVTGENTRLTALLSENSSERKQLFLAITKNGNEVIDRLSLGVQTLRTDLPINSPIDLDNGEYIASVVDDQGIRYASSYLRVAFIEIRNTPEISPYSFVIERDGKPIALKKIDVYVDGKLGPYHFENIDNVNVDVGKDAPGGDLAPGDHVFTFNIGKIKKDVKIVKPKSSNIFTEPVFLITVILSVLITGVGVFLARQEKVLYQIDIPDFPPVAKVNVPLSRDAILSIFDRVNEDYRWKYSTLNLTEIRNGFRKMLYQGKPIYITDYNAEYLLTQLEARGYVKEFLNYYGPTKWEQEAKASINFLALFRRIRDICVNNAMPFTQFEESSECDTEITAVGQKMYLHIYDKERDLAQLLKHVLSTIKEGMTIIIFRNEGTQSEFHSYLASSSKALLTLKLEVEGGSVALFTLEEFEAKIKELKGV